MVGQVDQNITAHDKNSRGSCHTGREIAMNRTAFLLKSIYSVEFGDNGYGVKTARVHMNKPNVAFVAWATEKSVTAARIRLRDGVVKTTPVSLRFIQHLLLKEWPHDFPIH